MYIRRNVICCTLALITLLGVSCTRQGLSIGTSAPAPFQAPAVPINSEVKGDAVNVKLIDAFSGQVIPNTDVWVQSRNGIWCFQAPCPTEEQQWDGKTDSNGIVFIPVLVLNVANTINAVGYSDGSGSLTWPIKQGINNEQLIELNPDSKIKIPDEGRRIKIIDSVTKVPLVGVTVWITKSKSCMPPTCSDYVFSGKTNTLGNFYFPLVALRPLYRLGEGWLFVSGYRPAEFTHSVMDQNGKILRIDRLFKPNANFPLEKR